MVREGQHKVIDACQTIRGLPRPSVQPRAGVRAATLTPFLWAGPPSPRSDHHAVFLSLSIGSADFAIGFVNTVVMRAQRRQLQDPTSPGSVADKPGPVWDGPSPVVSNRRHCQQDIGIQKSLDPWTPSFVVTE